MAKKRKIFPFDKERSDFHAKMARDFLESPAIPEHPFVIPHNSIRWRDSKGRFRKLPPNGKKPRGWKKVTVTTYTDSTRRVVKKPESIDTVSNRWIQYREPGSKHWKTADKVDFRKKLFARVVETSGDGKKPKKVYDLNGNMARIWTKHDKAESQRFLVPELRQDEKIELVLEGPTVRDALSRFSWEIAEYGQEVHIEGRVHYEYEDETGNRQRRKFMFGLVEDWRHAPNLGRWIETESGEKIYEPGTETYGSILQNRVGNEIRSGFANRQVRFTRLDTLTELYDEGLIDDELFEQLENRDQTENVRLFIMIRIRNRKKK